MLPAEHDLALEAADAADVLLRAGDIARAEDMFAEAAQLEAKALALIPATKTRTIGILGVSVAALWYRASQYRKAQAIAEELLKNDDLLPTTRSHLEDILSAIPRSVSVAAGGAVLTMPLADSPRTPPLRLIRQLEQIRDTARERQEFEDLFLSNRTLLMELATKKFRIPDADAEALVQEVFAAFAETESRIENVKSWLVAALCNASSHYWRLHRSEESLPADFAKVSDPTTRSLAEQFALQMTMHQVLGYLAERCRETIILHYYEGRSATDIAAIMGTTPRYAEKMIHNCLKRAREIYTLITKLPAT